jgi:hypothetical protein
MNSNVAMLNFDDVNQVLQYAIQNNKVADKDVQVFALALGAFKLELPYFIILQLNLINELFIYTYIVGNEVNVTSNKTCACPTPSMSETSKNSFDNIPLPDKLEGSQLDLSPEAIAASAGMFHKEIQIDPGTRTKHVKTYEHMADGTTKLVSEETLTEPVEEDIFANILGDTFSKDNNSPQLNSNDL